MAAAEGAKAMLEFAERWNGAVAQGAEVEVAVEGSGAGALVVLIAEQLA